MPFTPAHPAIVLPFLNVNKRFLSGTGLVVGSMAPDFEYFIKMRISSNHSHTIGGLFYFDLPISILVGITFHVIIKKNLISNLPAYFQKRLTTLRDTDFVGYIKLFPLALILSCLLGSFLHLFWDSFTHPSGFFVTHLSIYDTMTVPYEGVRYPLYYALQHVSTAIGLLVIALYVAFLNPDPEARLSKPHLLYWVVVIAITLIILFIRFGLHVKDAREGDLVASAITALALALVAAGFLKFRVTI